MCNPPPPFQSFVRLPNQRFWGAAGGDIPAIHRLTNGGRHCPHRRLGPDRASGICPQCQRSVPRVSHLYRASARRPEVRHGLERIRPRNTLWARRDAEKPTFGGTRFCRTGPCASSYTDDPRMAQSAITKVTCSIPTIIPRFCRLDPAACIAASTRPASASGFRHEGPLCYGNPHNPNTPHVENRIS
ncbi:hypothetical protein K227x_55740 [Rubripirellula lacrimiformis]|uniref:Uncharacterized protein n=1 Tax=Rubripirellula lacrimiformis TaxID=1930273 RepID=A0A517NJ31_9BACT|nr:hypothetical protein K227x_55740 [Rubripirellula lacrimiformis]